MYFIIHKILSRTSTKTYVRSVNLFTGTFRPLTDPFIKKHPRCKSKIITIEYLHKHHYIK